MRSMPGNLYDGHTLGETIEQVEILTDKSPGKEIASIKGSDFVEQIVAWDKMRKYLVSDCPACSRNLKIHVPCSPDFEPFSLPPLLTSLGFCEFSFGLRAVTVFCVGNGKKQCPSRNYSSLLLLRTLNVLKIVEFIEGYKNKNFAGTSNLVAL